ncbi:MAG: RNA polymerase sigma factor [Verrucomicrobiaceae bacterium]|nr:MAG: RNA polymerase sigma factor [Verrucomicrobiaceae bacterium]
MTASSHASALAAALPVLPTPDGTAEDGLIEAARGGCSQSFRTLLERHQQRVYHFCFHHLRDAFDAREACQDTFIRAHGALRRYRRRAQFVTWLFQIALNLCRDRLRARPAARGRLIVPLDDFEPRCQRATPDEASMRDTDLIKLERGLDSLPEKLREVLILSCLEGLSHGECAVILKCSERAIEGRLYRARQQLTAWWEREES